MRQAENRRAARLLCAGLVEVRWTDVAKGDCKAIANLDDLSAGGISLLLDQPLPLGVRVEFDHLGQAVSGNVRHCSRTEIGWIVGMQFSPDSRWDPEVDPPEHLLDPESVQADAEFRQGPHLSPQTRSTISCLVLREAVGWEEK